MKSVRREIKLMSSIQHDNIIQLLNAYENKRQIYIIMEYFEGITLLQFFRVNVFNLSMDLIKFIGLQLLRALDCLHRNGIAHRDVKPENILIDPLNGYIKLIDFGFATTTSIKSDQNCGTPNYMAPELLEKSPSYSADKVDVWAFGVCLFYLV
jgi:serine/threonine protein kinase